MGVEAVPGSSNPRQYVCLPLWGLSARGLYQSFRTHTAAFSRTLVAEGNIHNSTTPDLSTNTTTTTSSNFSSVVGNHSKYEEEFPAASSLSFRHYHLRIQVRSVLICPTFYEF